MLRAADISIPRLRNSILFYGALSSVVYFIFLLVMKAFGLVHVTELRMVNYVILCLMCIYQIKHWVHVTKAYMPFLQVFTIAFFTGLWSFLLFSIGLMIYTKFDMQFNELFVQNVPDTTFFNALPTTVILFEGSAVSIIVALICVQYSRKFEEGEAEPK